MANWCENCQVAEEGEHCSICGADLTAGEREPIPWRWRLFLVATVIYLVWRIYQLISWLSH
jgi:uncharacterized paraquat-inducible protein A